MSVAEERLKAASSVGVGSHALAGVWSAPSRLRARFQSDLQRRPRMSRLRTSEAHQATSSRIRVENVRAGGLQVLREGSIVADGTQSIESDWKTGECDLVTRDPARATSGSPGA